LRDAVGRQRQRRLRVAEGAAGVAVVLGCQLALDGAPDLLFLLGVGDLGDRVEPVPGQGRRGDLVPAGLGLGVGLARGGAGGGRFQARAAEAISLRRRWYSGSVLPGWSSARWTWTEPSSAWVTGE